MADNKIIEEIFKTIDIITDHKLYLTEYVYTEDCLIVAKTSDPFTYRVLHEHQEFDAYSPLSIDYNIGNSVVVLFTDYSRITKKIILFGTNQQNNLLFNSNITTSNSLGVGITNISLFTNNALTVGGTAAPSITNTYPLGSASLKWSEIYATNSSIITSDKNQKQDIESLSDIEIDIAKKIKSLIKKYRFNDSFLIKGDGARIHIGVIAQEVEAAFLEAGLDPNRYSLFCRDIWYEKNGKILNEYQYGAIEVERLGIRYDELFAFMIAAL